MCLKTINTEPFRIKTDMYVYKRFLVKINKNRRSITIKTPYQLMRIARNKVQHLNCIDFEYNTVDPVNAIHSEIQYGYHSYETKERALYQLYPSEIIVKCKIPAGSYVWFGLYDEVCSDKLIVDVTHNTKDIVTSACRIKDYEILNKCFKYMH